MRLPHVCLAVMLCVGTGDFARAAQTAIFADGRTLEIEGVERASGTALLTIQGWKGRLAVPDHQIVNWQELGPPPAEPPVARQEPPPLAQQEPLPMVEPWRAVAGNYADLIQGAAERYGLEPELLTAVARAESNFNPSAVSHKGACGLLQLMPATAARFGVRSIFDPEQNVDAGARYLGWLLERYGRPELALAGYNAGEGTVDRYRGVPPYPETRRYVERVLEGARGLSQLAP